MRKGTAVAAISVFLVCVLTPFPGEEADQAQATAVVDVPDFGFHPGRDEVFQFFRDVRVLGEYVGPEGEATEFMTWDVEVREAYVQAMVREFAAKRYGKPQANGQEMKEMLRDICEEGPVFGETEMRYRWDKGPVTRDLGRLHFSGHISLQFVWNMCTGSPRAGSKPVDPKSQVMAMRS